MRGWRSWRQALALRSSLVAAADLASASRRLRVMGEVFTVWQQYVQVRGALRVQAAVCGGGCVWCVI